MPMIAAQIREGDGPPPIDARTYRVQTQLRDGTPVCLRAIRPDDKPHFQTAFGRLSAKTIYRRLFEAKSQLTAEDLREFTELDFKNHVGLAVMITEGSKERLIGVGRFIRFESPPERAEIAFTVADDYQGRGAATLLLQHLMRLALRLGIREFVAYVQPDNWQMLEVFERVGLPVMTTIEDGVAYVTMNLEPAPSH